MCELVEILLMLIIASYIFGKWFQLIYFQYLIMFSIILGKKIVRCSMKKNTAIRKLLFDDPCSIEGLRINAEQERLLDVLSDLEEQLNKRLSGDETALDLFKKFKDASDDLYCEETCCLFERWIKYGILLGMELAQE